MKRRVIVTPYQPEWPLLYQIEASQLRQVFQSELVAIHHIGSTSVPQLAAKPIIDILAVVREVERVDEFIEAMAKLRYIAMGENGIPGRRFFYKGKSRRSHHVHIFAEDSPQIKRHLAFRDYLRHHPVECEQYGQLKKQLAKQFPKDIDSYVAGKSHLIRELEQKALIWSEQREFKK
ncbi:GrpB family protein [Thermoflavimicrobium daqui]|uniref:GrpB family protein n=1 Tax=Thermoflavimicrobium daqui TaxID=2137476 RepID=A0A364K3C1_9BACL|nr:GrpB family protein [Thermoflavimicrobium daqui]RAL23341.1 hypothetical protein DL897_11660 [Thermoflavimicrobium daqui]